MTYVSRVKTETIMMYDRKGRPIEVIVERKHKKATLRRLQEIYHFKLAQGTE